MLFWITFAINLPYAKEQLIHGLCCVALLRLLSSARWPQSLVHRHGQDAEALCPPLRSALSLLTLPFVASASNVCTTACLHGLVAPHHRVSNDCPLALYAQHPGCATVRPACLVFLAAAAVVINLHSIFCRRRTQIQKMSSPRLQTRIQLPSTAPSGHELFLRLP